MVDSIITETIPEDHAANNDSLSSHDTESRLAAAVDATTSVGTRKPGQSRNLSMISSQYDSSGKGYLTPAEQHMRQMDTEGEGRLSNEQVSSIVEETMKLKHTNQLLQFWIVALFGAVVILALSNLGTSFAAAVMAKDTSVDTSTGLLTVKGSSVPVVTLTQGTSMKLTVHYDENGNPFSCVDVSAMGILLNTTLGGIRNSLILESSNETGAAAQTVGLVAGGTGWNSQRVCLGTTTGSTRMCATFGDTRCAQLEGRRLMPGEAHSKARELREAVRQLQCYTRAQILKCSNGNSPIQYGWCWTCPIASTIVLAGQTQSTDPDP